MRSGFRCAVLLACLLCPAAFAADCGALGLVFSSRCEAGRDENGAYWLIAMPLFWNGELVLWNHGYSINPPAPLNIGDLAFLPLVALEGYAISASSYRPNRVGLGGWAVADAAEDTENLRRRFVSMFGQPRRTYVTGASEGGIVTVKTAEQFARDETGRLNYDGALAACGPLAGGQRAWEGALDLRVIYQFYCKNLPRPDEPQYDLWFGLDPTALPMQISELSARVNECTGVLLPPSARTSQQRANLAAILGAAPTPESFLITDMGYVTYFLQELAVARLSGKAPVGNRTAVYRGSPDDAALNAGVARYDQSPEGAQFFRSAYEPTGRLSAPLLTLHTIGDGLVLVEHEHAYRRTAEAADTQRFLQQVYVDAPGHCDFSIPEAWASFRALANWVESSRMPTAGDVARWCSDVYRPFTGGACRFNTGYTPAPYETRVPPR